MTQDITSLIEKLEGAGKGSRVFDGAIHRILRPNDLIMTDVGSVGPIKRDAVRQPLSSVPNLPDDVVAECVGAPQYSLSLDAALALAERVLTLGAWDVGYTYNSDRPYYARLVIVRDDEGQPEIYGRSATPALALCAAILRAQSEAR